MNILLTGGAGFIGSHLAENLIKFQHRVVCIDNFDPYYSREIKKMNLRNLLQNPLFSFHEIDIREKTKLDECLQNQQFDLVIHLAAKAGVRPSIQNPQLYYDVNVNGTLNLLESMKKCGVKRLIFASSSSVYGNNKKVPFSEDDKVDHPISPYAASKKAGELICYTYHALYNFDVFCLRFFTVYGPRQRPDMAIYKFVHNIANDIPIPFYGDGSSQRDYTYIIDIVDGIMGAIAKLKGYEIINLGESSTISLSEMIKVLEKEIGKKSILEKLPMQPGDVDITYADIEKARRLLNYNPQMLVEEGLNRFVKWYQQQHAETMKN
jgi:UDP-glucuronate 4-epimerase